jgi:hypothetical protein
MASTNETIFNTPMKKKNGKLLLKVGKKRTTSEVIISPVFESSPSTASTVSAQSSMDFLSSSSQSLLSAVSKTSLLTSTTSTIKKRLVLNNDNNHVSKKPKKKTQRVDSKANHQEPKLAAYDIDWFDSASTQNDCLKHTSSMNLPSTQEEQLTFICRRDWQGPQSRHKSFLPTSSS